LTKEAVMAATVLVVEDEPLVGMGIQLVLEDEGYEVMTVDCGEAALDAAASRPPSLVLMDVNLRGAMDGIQAARLLSAAYGLPIIFVTAQTDAATRTKALETHPRGFLRKPFTPEQLVRAIGSALGGPPEHP
jgi:CheY-like chemotaxis protein